jgi:predicted RNA-binding Zn-ribbon protein involved in translation (DUF1610 family)
MKRASFGPTIQSKPDFCPTCDGRRIIKRGLRKNCFRRLQIYSCKDCGDISFLSWDDELSSDASGGCG